MLDLLEASPVAQATVAIDSEGDDGLQSALTVKTDDDGRFIIRSAAAGMHKIVATSPAHLRSSPTLLRLGANDATRDVVLRVPRATKTAVRVVTPSGMPLVDSAILVVSAGVFQTVMAADEQGRAEVPVASGSASTLYVFPRSGSFAITRLQDSPREERRIVVPEGTASLRLRTTDTLGRPIGNVRFLMRFDGELIPPDVASWVERNTGMPMRTDASGEASLLRLPPGLAELWPLRAASEVEGSALHCLTLRPRSDHPEAR